MPNVTKDVDVSALIRLKACRGELTFQQYKTLRGQVLAGDAMGAMKGLQRLKEKLTLGGTKQ